MSLDRCPELGYKYGGWATICRVEYGLNNEIYLYFGEIGGLQSIKWSILKDRQDELKEIYGLQRAYIKF